MPKFFTLANARHIRQCKIISSGAAAVYLVLNLILGSLAIGMIVLGLFNTASLTQGGYKLKLLEEEKINLLKEQETLAGQISRAQAMSEVEKRLAGLNLEKIASIEYLPSSSAAVAVRN